MSTAKKGAKKANKLSVQQQRFVENILKGMNQTDAYIAAGYKSKGKAAENNASRLMGNDRVQAKIRAVRDKANKAAEITQIRLIEEESRLALYDPKELFDESGSFKPIPELSENIRRAIVGFEVIHTALGGLKYKYKFHDKGRALERLEKIEGMFAPEKKDIEGELIISWEK